MSKKLTPELILMKLKHSNIQSITNLNLWGSDLDDISLLAQMPMLEIVSLSVNKIRSLKPFLNHQHLKQLSLRKNLICDFGEVKYLSTCPNLSILWLNENPISDNPNYRSAVIKLIPSLVKLDDIPINDSERDQCLCGDYNNDYQQPQYYRYERQHSNKKEYDYDRGNNQYKYMRHNSDYSNKYYKGEEYSEEYNNFYDNNNNQMKRRTGKNFYNNNRKEFDDFNIQRRSPYNESPIRYQNNNNMYQDEYQQPSQREYKEKDDTKGSNIMNCMVMLLSELNDNELEYIKEEIDKKIAKY